MATTKRNEDARASVRFGERHGLYELTARSGPVTSATLARETGLSEARLWLWLQTQASRRYVVLSRDGERYQSWCEIDASA